MVVVALAVVIVVLLSARSVAGFYTDYLWFDSVGFTGVWQGLLSAKIGLVVLFMAVAFGIVWVNLFIADRLAPRFRPPGPEEEASSPSTRSSAGRPAWPRRWSALLPPSFVVGV